MKIIVLSFIYLLVWACVCVCVCVWVVCVCVCVCVTDRGLSGSETSPLVCWLTGVDESIGSVSSSSRATELFTVTPEHREFNLSRSRSSFSLELLTRTLSTEDWQAVDCEGFMNSWLDNDDFYHY